MLNLQNFDCCTVHVSIESMLSTCSTCRLFRLDFSKKHLGDTGADPGFCQGWRASAYEAESY